MDEALKSYARALRIFESELGRDSRPVSWCLNDLGIVHFEMGRYAEAAQSVERAIEIKRQVLGPDHPDVAFSLGNLAEIHMRLGKYAAALSTMERSIEIQTEKLGSDHPQVGLAYQTLGEIHRRLGHFEQARRALNRALAIHRSDRAGATPEMECWILGSFAHLELDTAHYSEAEPLFVQTIRLREELFGLDHVDLAETLDGYAKLLRATGRDDEAEPIEARARRIRANELSTKPGELQVKGP